VSEFKMADLEMLLKRTLVDRLEKAIAASLTAAYETRIAGYAASGTPVTPEDRKRFQAEVLETYYRFFSIVNTTNPKPANSIQP
jgi:hypothetical protein